MNRLAPLFRVLAFAAGLAVIGLPAARAQDPSAPVNERCPLSQEPIDGSTFTTFQGKSIGFCCPACKKPFEVWSDERKQRFLQSLGQGPARSPSSPLAKPAGESDHGEPYSLGTCPVSGAELGSMGEPVVRRYRGREVRFCCAGCLGTFEADPGSHFARIDAAIVSDQLRFYPLERCVVSGTALADREPRNLVWGNRLVRLCGDECEQEFRAQPQGWLHKLNEAAAKSQRPSYPLEKCVVGGSALGSMGEPSEMVVAGRLLRFCCAGCEPKVSANPLPYLQAVDAAWAALGKYVRPASRPAAPEAGHDDRDH